MKESSIGDHRSATPSISIHLLATRNTRLLLCIQYKLIDNARPSSILAPEAQRLVRQALLVEFVRLVPHVLVNALGPLLLQEGEPEIKPVRRVTLPGHTGRAEKHLPDCESGLEGECFLALLFGADEGVLVDFLEEDFVGADFADEAGDVGLLLG